MKKILMIVLYGITVLLNCAALALNFLDYYKNDIMDLRKLIFMLLEAFFIGIFLMLIKDID